MASRLTIKRIDPWSVLKFGAVANLALLAIFMLMAGVVWFIIDRLELIEQVCTIAADIGFTTCGVNAGNLFRALALLGLLGVVVQTAVLVFFAFLHNLIADLTGGLVVGVIDEPTTRREPRRVTTATSPPVHSSNSRGAATSHGPQGTRTSAGAQSSSTSQTSQIGPDEPARQAEDGPAHGREQPSASRQRTSTDAGEDSLFGSRQ